MDLSMAADLRNGLASTSAGLQVRCGSASMHPTIGVGEQVRAHAVPLAELKVGDVVVYEGAEGYMMHRIALFGPGRQWFLHAGDAPSKMGARRALTERIIGRVKACSAAPFGWRGTTLFWTAPRLLSRQAKSN